MSVIVSGSMAFDNIMNFQDKFKNHILPDKVHMLNISFLTPKLRREFGGCAGNIAYNLKLLGVDSRPLATVGSDFIPYNNWLEDKGVDCSLLKVIEEYYTAQAYIITDQDDNQITAFHPGAMEETHQTHVPDEEGIKIGIVSPNGREGMIQHAQQFADLDIPFIFDPGQGLPMFGGSELLDFIEKASWVAVNDYELQMLMDKTGLSTEDIAAKVGALIVTLGPQGSTIYTEGKKIGIEPAKADAIVDPTGCGDSYRAGLIFGLINQYDWTTIGRISSLMGAIKIASAGTQNHSFTMDRFHQLYQESFGSDF
ncbi:MAG: carbohydrate kinase family protein [Gammaproteobacteria bacterium]|nr:MAG: carbohydrate kinase family protein [Gammaproteobacteria bacterium]